MLIILSWFALAILTEAIVEIIVGSELLFTFRNFFAKINPGFLGKLFTCGYCMSVWVASIIIVFVNPYCIVSEYLRDYQFSYIIDIIIKILILHRISNIWHEALSRWFNKYPIITIYHVNNENKEKE